jgi:hypothetical protein
MSWFLVPRNIASKFLGPYSLPLDGGGVGQAEILSGTASDDSCHYSLDLFLGQQPIAFWAAGAVFHGAARRLPCFIGEIMVT